METERDKAINLCAKIYAHCEIGSDKLTIAGRDTNPNEAMSVAMALLEIYGVDENSPAFLALVGAKIAELE